MLKVASKITRTTSLTSERRRSSVFFIFFCEICKIFKNTFFTEHLRTAASGHCNTGIFIGFCQWYPAILRTPTYEQIMFKIRYRNTKLRLVNWMYCNTRNAELFSLNFNAIDNLIRSSVLISDLEQVIAF